MVEIKYSLFFYIEMENEQPRWIPNVSSADKRNPRKCFGTEGLQLISLLVDNLFVFYIFFLKPLLRLSGDGTMRRRAGSANFRCLLPAGGIVSAAYDRSGEPDRSFPAQTDSLGSPVQSVTGGSGCLGLARVLSRRARRCCRQDAATGGSA